MMLTIPKMILIDVDGTMVDSVPDLAYCVDVTMREMNIPERGEAAVRNWVGNGVEKLVHRALTNDLDGEADAALFDKAMPIFRSCYAKHTCVHSTLYPGVAEALAWMQAQGFKLGCVTNKAEQFTLPILEQLQVRDYFGIVVSGDTLPQKKPDPAPLLHVAEFFGVEPAKSLMIGDSVSDVKAARAAGFGIACMSYGYNHGLDIRDFDPDVVVDRMDALIPLFD
jgi:phosphoglycolate phosphatase